MTKNILIKIFYTLLHPLKKAKLMGLEIGCNHKIGRYCDFGAEPYLIKIGDNFYSSSHVQFVTHDGSVNVLQNMYSDLHDIDCFSPIVIGNNVFIGFGTTILPGTVIGDNVIVGAGSIVKGMLKSNSVYAGVPVKYICTIDEYKLKNEANFINTKKLPSEEKKQYVKSWVDKHYPSFSKGEK